MDRAQIQIGSVLLNAIPDHRIFLKLLNRRPWDRMLCNPLDLAHLVKLRWVTGYDEHYLLYCRYLIDVRNLEPFLLAANKSANRGASRKRFYPEQFQ